MSISAPRLVFVIFTFTMLDIGNVTLKQTLENHRLRLSVIILFSISIVSPVRKDPPNIGVVLNLNIFLKSILCFTLSLGKVITIKSKIFANLSNVWFYLSGVAF